jgi:hypothetical protein
MPLATAPQGTPQMPYTRNDYYPQGMREQELALNEIIEGIEEESEILEPTARELLAATLSLVYAADFNLAFGPIEPFQDAIDTVQEDLLPPESTYNSFKELLKSARDWGKQYGYDLSVLRSKKTPGKDSQVRVKGQLGCDRRESVRVPQIPPIRNKDGTERDTKARGTGCLFSMNYKEGPDGKWKLSHRELEEHRWHNHQLDVPNDPGRHPVRNRLDIKMTKLI